MSADEIVNFGANLRFTPQAFYTPETEEEVLAILEKHRGQQVRVIGRLHSWSDAPRGEGVVLDLRKLNQVVIERRGAETWAKVGAGCQIQRLLDELDREGLTTPSVGLITEQAVAGAMSTGTHGSGKNSLSHYMAEVRVATYDESGVPIIRTIDSGPELQAARCALGCLGVVLSVGFKARPQYNVEEVVRPYTLLDDVLAAEAEFPLQQFYFLPWRWSFAAQHRREVDAPRSWLTGLYCWHWFLAMDVALHLLLMTFCRLLRFDWLTRSFYRYVLPWIVIYHWRVVGRSFDILTMEHELYRHIECELFVTRGKLAAALEFLRATLTGFSLPDEPLPPEFERQLAELGLAEEFAAARGCYTHHYAICVRRILPDDTLISMASGGNESWYALSLVSYENPQDREGFFRFARFASRSMGSLFNARPHWGKVCPLDAEQVAARYPQWDEFKAICRQSDPHGNFLNAWLRGLFGDS